jgi:hypothetical protein
MIDFYGLLYGKYAIRGHLNPMILKSLQQLATLPQRLQIVQPLKNFPAFYGT